MENEDRISRTSMYLSFDTSILIFEKMQKIALSKTEEYIQTEALSIMNLILMASNHSEREKFGLVQLLEGLPQLLQKEIVLCVRKQAVRLLFLLLNCPKMLSMFCDWQRDDHAEVADCLIATREQTNHILEGLAECLASAGATTQELKLQRDVIVMLAFIASSGKSGFDVLLYSATPQRVNILELIIRVLAFEMDGKNYIAKSQIICKERISLIREALILLNRLASSPAYSRVTLAVLTSNATARLTIDVANRMSRKSRSQQKHDGTKKLQVEDEIVDLARLFKARVFTFLGESNP